jgi:hypothetical protein
MVTALAIVGVIGDVRRFPSARQLVGSLGLDPRVRQSAERAARIGRISRQGQSHARGLLIEAAHSAVKTPGPLRAFCARSLRHRPPLRQGEELQPVAEQPAIIGYAAHSSRVACGDGGRVRRAADPTQPELVGSVLRTSAALGSVRVSPVLGSRPH